MAKGTLEFNQILSLHFHSTKKKKKNGTAAVENSVANI